VQSLGHVETTFICKISHFFYGFVEIDNDAGRVVLINEES
jgi:hypothetical protein